MDTGPILFTSSKSASKFFLPSGMAAVSRPTAGSGGGSRSPRPRPSSNANKPSPPVRRSNSTSYQLQKDLKVEIFKQDSPKGRSPRQPTSLPTDAHNQASGPAATNTKEIIIKFNITKTMAPILENNNENIMSSIIRTKMQSPSPFPEPASHNLSGIAPTEDYGARRTY